MGTWVRASRESAIGWGITVVLLWGVAVMAISSSGLPSLRSVVAVAATYVAGFALAGPVWIFRAPARARRGPPQPPSFDELVLSVVLVMTHLGIGAMLILNPTGSTLIAVGTGLVWLLFGLNAGTLAIRVGELLWRAVLASLPASPAPQGPPPVPEGPPPTPYGPHPGYGAQPPAGGGAPTLGPR